MDRLTERDGEKTFLTEQPLKSECCQCLRESNFVWQHADKLKELGVEV